MTPEAAFVELGLFADIGLVLRRCGRCLGTWLV
jgi:hypothetical protein